ncbi:iron chelate uptake ABC transporter family permease subunit [Vibrio sp.]|nr:iron chelate uptake ABC transporter family permease subunit [Vibrio sp.]
MREMSQKVFRWHQFSWLWSPQEIALFIVLGAVLCALSLYILSLGTIPLSLHDIYSALIMSSHQPLHELTIWNIRLPRLITAIFVGASLGVAGAVFQSISRNALGSPDIIGFTTGSASGALISIIYFSASQTMIMLSSILGGLTTAYVVLILSRQFNKTSSYALILSGVGMSAILMAVNGLLLVKGDLDLAITANLWLAGSLSARTWQHALPIFIAFIVIAPIVSFLARPLRMIEMGDAYSQQVGISVEPVRKVSLIFAVILTAIATASAGPIAFIALAAPRLFSSLSGSVLPILGSALCGAILLTSADVISQLSSFNLILPIGQVTGLLGGCYLLWILIKSNN